MEEDYLKSEKKMEIVNITELIPAIINSIQDILSQIVRIPVKLYQQLPLWVKVSMLIIIIVFGIIIGVYAYKNRLEWQKLVY